MSAWIGGRTGSSTATGAPQPAFVFLTAKLLDWRERETELEASANPFVQVVLAHSRALTTATIRKAGDGTRHS